MNIEKPTTYTTQIIGQYISLFLRVPFGYLKMSFLSEVKHVSLIW